jgi:hypothetical protein
VKLCQIKVLCGLNIYIYIYIYVYICICIYIHTHIYEIFHCLILVQGTPCSRNRRRRFRSPGMLCCVIGQVVSSVYKDHSTFIFGLKQSKKALLSFETSGTACLVGTVYNPTRLGFSAVLQSGPQSSQIASASIIRAKCDNYSIQPAASDI